MTVRIISAGKTDVGHVRSANEDTFKIDDERNLFLVCDGMGGHQAGEVASHEACNVISYCISELRSELATDSVLALPARFPSSGDLLVKAIRIANRSVYLKSRSRSDYTGMGTTVVGAILQGDMVNIAHVGDSRAYRLLPDRLIPLTRDHSWVAELEESGKYTREEAAKLANRNVITRALGIHETVEIDFRSDRMEKGDVYIFCSDGLCGYVEDEDIYSVAKESRNDVERLVTDLVQMANDRGGLDNVTVVAFRVEDVGKSDIPVVSPVTIPVEGDDLILRENQIVESIVKLNQTAQKVITRTGSEQQASKLPMLFLAIFIVAVLAVIYFFYLK
nr:Stp1/IreP family PP2C-type Ser/Thr phosphatase [candidate division Zixibacteria bacterium]